MVDFVGMEVLGFARVKVLGQVIMEVAHVQVEANEYWMIGNYIENFYMESKVFWEC